MQHTSSASKSFRPESMVRRRRRSVSGVTACWFVSLRACFSWISWASPAPEASTSFDFDGAMAAGEERVEEGGRIMGRVLQDKTAYATGRGVRSQAPGGRQVPRKWSRHRRESLQKIEKGGRSASGLILVSQLACLGPADMRVQSCCANDDVERWACTPVITSVGCVCVPGRGAGAGTETGTGNARLLQACQVPRWTQLSSRMVDKGCAGTAQGTQVCRCAVQ